MKKLLLTIILFFTTITNAQKSIEITRNWASYSQFIDVSNKIGYDFRISVAIRAESKTKGYLCGFWARVDTKGNHSNFFENNGYSIKPTNEWKVYQINGTIKEDATNLYFGAFTENNGDFYFDDFKLEIKKGKEKWKTIEISNPEFENEKSINDLWNIGIVNYEKITIKNFTIEYSSNNPYKGKKCLHIQGKNIIGNNENGKFVDVNGVSLYYETYGEGEPLLLLHGNGGSISAFMNQVEEFSKLYKVIIVDCRGRGNSTYQKDLELNFDIQIEDLNQFLDKINIPKTHIVGWSDGGILGLLMAIQHPEKVNKLVSMAGNIFPDGCVDLVDMIKTRDELVADNKEHKNDLVIDLYNLDIKYPNLKYENLNVIKSKTLIMAGDHDEIKTEHTVKMFEAIPEAQLAILPNSTHYLPEQNPKLFNQIVLDFLK
jgi:pimeloyl-ACP methyl ester carboxylesterase